jgi:hypothetical protein
LPAGVTGLAFSPLAFGTKERAPEFCASNHLSAGGAKLRSPFSTVLQTAWHETHPTQIQQFSAETLFQPTSTASLQELTFLARTYLAETTGVGAVLEQQFTNLKPIFRCFHPLSEPLSFGDAI